MFDKVKSCNRKIYKVLYSDGGKLTDPLLYIFMVRAARLGLIGLNGIVNDVGDVDLSLLSGIKYVTGEPDSTLFSVVAERDLPLSEKRFYAHSLEFPLFNSSDLNHCRFIVTKISYCTDEPNDYFVIEFNIIYKECIIHSVDICLDILPESDNSCLSSIGSEYIIDSVGEQYQFYINALIRSLSNPANRYFRCFSIFDTVYRYKLYPYKLSYSNYVI